LYDLNEYLDPKNYKSYEALTRKLQDVLGVPNLPPTVETAPAPQARSKPAPTQKTAEPAGIPAKESEDVESFFANLAAEDDE
jgi:hypothetical protein